MPDQHRELRTRSSTLWREVPTKPGFKVHTPRPKLTAVLPAGSTQATAGGRPPQGRFQYVAGPTETSAPKPRSWKPSLASTCAGAAQVGTPTPRSRSDPGSGFPAAGESAHGASGPRGPARLGEQFPRGRGAAHVTRAANRGPRREGACPPEQRAVETGTAAPRAEGTLPGKGVPVPRGRGVAAGP